MSVAHRRYRRRRSLTSYLLPFDADHLRATWYSCGGASTTIIGETLFDEDMPTDDASNLDQIATWAGALVAAVFARKALTAVWASVTGDEPPQNPASSETQWGEALLWGAAAGMVAGLARTIGRRLASGAVSGS